MAPGQEVHMAVCSPTDLITHEQQERCKAAFKFAYQTFDGRVQSYDPGQENDEGNF